MAAHWLMASEALAVLHELRSNGLDADIDLPRICVVGKQSSGKSSVMEALAGISLPRAAGTCTRCAFEISTRKADTEFACAVSVRSQVNGAGSKERVCLASAECPSSLPDMLKGAQRVLLNRDLLQRRWSDIKSGAVLLKELEAELPQDGGDSDLFSRDVVVVEIRGRSFTDLELIDLPGLIQSVERDEEKDLIGLIEGLCAAYLEKPNTLIAMCCPFNDDMENQAVRMIARKYDPEGKRTVGVLTKADLLQKGTETEWLAILQNKKFELCHGYFVLRNPSQDELDSGISSDDARQKELLFFKDDQLGQRLHDAEPRRCGIVALRTVLSNRLCDLIRRELPDLYIALQKQLADSESRLQRMGEEVQPHHARTRLASLVQQLQNALAIAIEAKGDPPYPFWSEVRKSYQNLCQSCFDARPRFVIGEQELDDHDLVNPEIVSLQLEKWSDWTILFECLDQHQVVEKDVTLNSQKVYKGFKVKGPPWTGFESPSQKFSVVGNYVYARSGQVTFDLPHAWSDWATAWMRCSDAPVPVEGAGDIVRTYRWRPQELLKTPNSVVKFPVTVTFELLYDRSTSYLTIPDITERIRVAFGRELNLPGGPAGYRTAQEIIREAQARWAAPATSCLEVVALKLAEQVKDSTMQIMHVYSELEKKVVQFLLSLISELQGELAKRKSELLDRLEGAPDLFTQNDHYLKDSFDKAQHFIRQHLHRTVQMAELSAEEQNKLKELLGKAGGLRVEDLYMPDPRDDAIWCMAAAHAYHKVAFKRFCDMLPRTIDEIFLRGFLQRSQDVLMAGLQVMEGDNEQLCQWFVEDDAVRQQRKEFKMKIERQRKGLELLQTTLMQSHK